MKLEVNSTHVTLYLEWINDWLTIDRMAEHYNMTPKKLSAILKSGKRQHEKNVRKQTQVTI